MTDPEPWLGLTEAAQRTGLAREAIRARARRGLISSRKGNDGRLLVQIPAGLVADAGQGEAGAVADLTAEVAELREALARTEAARDAAVAIGEARAAALRELADRLTVELTEARRPWWRRLLDG